jgi:O-acetyl-ADP-ribose deacetylase (regulator of RNase III)
MAVWLYCLQHGLVTPPKHVTFIARQDSEQADQAVVTIKSSEVEAREFQANLKATVESVESALACTLVSLAEFESQPAQKAVKAYLEIQFNATLIPAVDRSETSATYTLFTERKVHKQALSCLNNLTSAFIHTNPFTDQSLYGTETAVIKLSNTNVSILIVEPQRLFFHRADMRLCVSVIEGDITKQATEAVVNAANAEMKLGAGVCGAIFQAAGEHALENECSRVMKQRDRRPLDIGEAVHTRGGRLANYIIHVVGPRREKHSEQACADLVTRCFVNCLHKAVQLDVKSVAIPAISSGTYQYFQAFNSQMLVFVGLFVLTIIKN